LIPATLVPENAPLACSSAVAVGSTEGGTSNSSTAACHSHLGSTTSIYNQRHPNTAVGICQSSRLTITSINSTSPRSHMRDPFDDHPSCPSPLEKQRLDFQLKLQNPPRNGGGSYVRTCQVSDQQY
jgi:hypothetical protein